MVLYNKVPYRLRQNLAASRTRTYKWDFADQMIASADVLGVD